MRMAATLAYPDFEAITASGAFESVAAGGHMSTLVTEQGDIPRQRRLYFANHDFFSTLGVSIALGRAFAADEDLRGAAPVAVLSHAYWRSAFNADRPAEHSGPRRLRSLVAGVREIELARLAPRASLS